MYDEIKWKVKYVLSQWFITSCNIALARTQQLRIRAKFESNEVFEKSIVNEVHFMIDNTSSPPYVQLFINVEENHLPWLPVHWVLYFYIASKRHQGHRAVSFLTPSLVSGPLAWLLWQVYCTIEQKNLVFHR